MYAAVNPNKYMYAIYPIGTHAGLIKMHLQKINVCMCALLMLQKCIIIMSLKMHKECILYCYSLIVIITLIAKIFVTNIMIILGG